MSSCFFLWNTVYDTLVFLIIGINKSNTYICCFFIE
jgi:hypothetical protein